MCAEGSVALADELLVGEALKLAESQAIFNEKSAHPWPATQPPKRSTLKRRMAGVAPSDRPVTGQVRRRVAMTTETEVVKARFGADPNGSAAAAVTTDARIATALIGEVVMTLNAVHRAMFVVRKAQHQRFTTAQERFTQGQSRSTTQQCKQRDERAEDDCQHEPRMPSEHESAQEARRLLSRPSLGARA